MNDFDLICTLQKMAWMIRLLSGGHEVHDWDLKDLDTRISELAKTVPLPQPNRPSRREDYDPPACPGRIGE